MRTESGRIEVFGFGPMADDMQSLALFRLGEQKLIEIILEEAEVGVPQFSPVQPSV